MVCLAHFLSPGSELKLTDKHTVTAEIYIKPLVQVNTTSQDMVKEANRQKQRDRTNRGKDITRGNGSERAERSVGVTQHISYIIH